MLCHAHALGGRRACFSPPCSRRWSRSGPAAGSAGAVKLTFIGDSKAAAINYSAKAKRLLSRGHDVRRDLRVCRRLVAPSCAYPPGVYPRTALEAIRHYGTGLGTVLVIDVGYNDSSATYRGHLNQRHAGGAEPGREGRRVGEPQGRPHRLRAINRSSSRPAALARLHVANWNRHSRGSSGLVLPTHRRRHPPDRAPERSAS